MPGSASNPSQANKSSSQNLMSRADTRTNFEGFHNSASNIHKTSMQSLLFQLISIFLILNIAINAILYVSLMRSRSSNEERARATAESMAQLIGKQVDNVFFNSKISVLAIKDQIHFALQNHIDIGPNLQKILADHKLRVESISFLRFADKEGNILYGTGINPNDHYNIGDRPYFTDLINSPLNDVRYSSPLIGKVTNQWVSIISTRCSRSDGSFYGIAYATVASKGLNSLIADLSVGRKGSAVVSDNKFYTVAANSNSILSVPAIGSKDVTVELANQLQSGASTGSFFHRDSDSKYVAAFHRNSIYPGFVVYRIAEEDYLRTWNQEVRYSIAISVGFFCISTLLALLVLLHWRSQQRFSVALEEREQYFHIIADYTYGWEYWMAPDGKFIYVSPACERVTGYTPEEFAMNEHLLANIMHKDDMRKLSMHLECDLAEPHDETEIEFRITRRDGEVRWIMHGCRPVFGSSGQYLGRRANNRDITDKVHIIEQLQVLAQTDSLTGLANRRAFSESFENEFKRSRRYNGPTAVLMLDIDHFKITNDKYGHDCGDLVLVSLASTLTAAVRATDKVARWGGEEFVILLTNTTLQGACEFAERLRQMVSEQIISSPKGPLHASISIGVSEVQLSDQTWQNSLSRADAALFQAKNMGRNRVAVSE